MKSKLQIGIIVLSVISVFSLLFFYSCEANYDSNFVDSLPIVTISNNSDNITGQIIRYNVDKTSGSLDRSKYSNEFIKVSAAKLLRVDWSETAHAYSVQRLEDGEWKNVSVSENKLTAPIHSGIYEYKIVAEWYDKGRITYYFKINVE